MTSPTDHLPIGPQDADSASDETRERLPAAVDNAPGPGPSRAAILGVPRVIVGAGVVVLVVVGLILVLTLLSSSDHSAAEFQTRVSTIMKPVIDANRSLSRALVTVHGIHPVTAQRRVAAAQSATLTARGGLAALTVPSGSAQLASNARGTLTRETIYLAAVGGALSHPARDGASQTETLAGNLTGALDVIAPANDDWAASVTGSDTLTSWAPRAAAAIRRHAAALITRRRTRARQQQSSASTSQSAPAFGAGTDCGNNLHAGPNTSCPFAINVRDAYNAAPGATATVEVFSPVNNQTYSMSCAPAGNGVTCSGANNASVTWTF